MSTNILKSMAIQSVAQALGWDQYGSIVKFMKSLKTFSIYPKTNKCIIMIPMEP